MKQLYVYGWKSGPCLLPAGCKWKPDKRETAWCIEDEETGRVVRKYIPPPGYKRRKRSLG